MIPMYGQLTLLGLGVTVVAGFLCVRMLEERDIRRMTHHELEEMRRHPQMRLF